jgi:hypothetical protein
MSAITSNGTGGGNASSGSSWAGGVAPVDGDTITVANGDTITQDVDRIYGSKSSNVGDAITVNGSVGSFGTLKVNSGVTLTLRGTGTSSNRLGIINRYGLFQPLAGSTIRGDVASEFGSILVNQGNISAIWDNVSPILWSVPTATASGLWGVAVASESYSVSTQPAPYQTNINILSRTLANPWISNAAHTGPGSFGDTSLVINSATPSMTTEVRAFTVSNVANNGSGLIRVTAAGHGYSTGNSVWLFEVQGVWDANGVWTVTVIDADTFDLQSSAYEGTYVAGGKVAALTSSGRYYVDYEQGVVYMYSTSTTGNALNVSYYHLDLTAANWRGWGIISNGNQTGCTCLLDGCVFEYMGANGNGFAPTISGVSVRQSAPVAWYGHQSVGMNSGLSNRLAYLKHSTFRYGMRYLCLTACNGSSGDPLLIQGNTFLSASGGTIWDGIACYAEPLGSSYITVDANRINHRGTFVDFTTVNADVAHFTISNNYGCAAFAVVRGDAIGGARTPFPALNDPDASYAMRPTTPDLSVTGNWIRGIGDNGGGVDSRTICVSGTSGHPAIIENNVFRNNHRLGHQIGSYVIVRNNVFAYFYHHGFTGSSVDDTYCTSYQYYNNLFISDRTGTVTQCGASQIGYNHRNHLDDYVFAGNTIDGGRYGLDFNDLPDTSGQTLGARLQIVNNIFANVVAYGFVTYRSASVPWNVVPLECDYNDVYNAGAFAVTGSNGLANGTKATGFSNAAGKYNRDDTRAILGVHLFDGTYTAAASGKSLVYTVNTLGQDHTLAWDGGTPAQIIRDYGTSAGGGLRTIACSSTQTTWNNSNVGIRGNWLWIVSGTGAGQARCITWASANVCHAVSSIAAAGSGYSVGQYIKTTGGTADTPGHVAVFKVTSVSGGGITGLSLVSGGCFTTVPSNPVSTTRVTGSSGGSCTLNLSWAPGLVLVPDLGTAVDNTSVFAVVNAMSTLSDSGPTQSVKACIDPRDPDNVYSAVVLPTSSQTDSGISVSVSHTITSNPAFSGSTPSLNPAHYQWAAGSPVQDAGTADGGPSSDYWGTSRPQGSSVDMGLYELLATLTATAAGGLVGGGAFGLSSSFTSSAAGGPVGGGQSQGVFTLVATAAGGLVLAGGLTPGAAYTPTSAGGAVLDGTADIPGVSVAIASGGIVLAGGISPGATVNASPSGGAVLGGDVTPWLGGLLFVTPDPSRTTWRMY